MIVHEQDLLAAERGGGIQDHAPHDSAKARFFVYAPVFWWGEFLTGLEAPPLRFLHPLTADIH